MVKYRRSESLVWIQHLRRIYVVRTCAWNQQSFFPDIFRLHFSGNPFAISNIAKTDCWVSGLPHVTLNSFQFQTDQPTWSVANSCSFQSRFQWIGSRKKDWKPMVFTCLVVVEPYPSEKWWTSSIGIMTFPTKNGNIIHSCSKPPSSFYICFTVFLHASCRRPLKWPGVRCHEWIDWASCDSAFKMAGCLGICWRTHPDTHKKPSKRKVSWWWFQQHIRHLKHPGGI